MNFMPGKQSAYAARLARLVRYAHDAELSEVARHLIGAMLTDEISPAADNSSGPKAVPAPTIERSFERQAAMPLPAVSAPDEGGLSDSDSIITDVDASVDASAEASVSPMFQRAAQLELKIRQLVEAEAQWAQLAPLCWELLSVRPGPETAARLLEIAFLHGGGDQLESILLRLKQHARDFYTLVHPAIRAHLTVYLWREGRGESLAGILLRSKDEAWLQPVERFYTFYTLARAAGEQDPATAYIYFRLHKPTLLNASRDLGQQLGLPLPRLLLMAGRLAFELGYSDEARELLADIRPDTSEHAEALRLMLELRDDDTQRGGVSYVELLVSQSSPRDRLATLRTFFQTMRDLGGIKDRNRPALNDILRHPLEFVGEDSEAWAELSELLAGNRDLEPLLPNLFETFRANATRFHAPKRDDALWQGPLLMHAATSAELYWRGVAQLHHYANCGPTAEMELWRARDNLLASHKSAVGSARIPYDWHELHRAVTAWVTKTQHLNENDRQRMLRQLRIALDPEKVSTSDIDDYLQHAEEAPLTIMQHLQTLVASKADAALECRIILRRARATHLVNVDLNRLWHLATTCSDHDFAWRVASILFARQSLAPSVRHAWEISGENRSFYSFMPLTLRAAEQALRGLSPQVARLAHACLYIGPRLPELLAMLDPGVSVSRITAAPAGSLESRIEKALANLSWLSQPKRRYRFSFEGAGVSTAMPAFAQILPANPWSILVAKLAEYLGLTAWGWRLSRLHTQIVDLIPRIASRQDLSRNSSKMAKWLQSLTLEQRAAWRELALLSRSIADDEAMEGLAAFICRIATMMHQSHVMALQSLHSMRAPLSVVWDLEAWILGDVYGSIREKLRTQHRLPVPNTLAQISEITR